MHLWGIFQDKLDELISEIKGVKTYIGNILFLGKEKSKINIEHTRFIFAGMGNTNTKKCSFGLNKVPFLFISGSSHLNSHGLFLSPCRPRYVST